MNPRGARRSRHPARGALHAVVVVALLVAAPAAASASTAAPPSSPSEAFAAATEPALAGWQWPVEPPRIVAAFVAPPHPYGPGHRGIDLAAPSGTEVHAPAAGTIAFVGAVAGRGVVTIDHGDGLVTTLEPVALGTAARVAIGDAVAAGDVVGVADSGGHTPFGAVHFGVRRHGEYINPMLLLGSVPRAVLLPCC